MIGIISGAGPLAGLDVAKKLIEETVASRDQEHLPVLLFSLPAHIPDRVDFLMGKSSANPGYAIGQLFLQSEKAGATVAAIACNTAHANPIFGEVYNCLEAENSQLQILHLIEVTVEHLDTNYSKGKVGVLSTIGTRRQSLYKDPLIQAGFEVLEPSDKTQERVNDVIFHTEFGIKAQSSPVTEKATTTLMEAMEELVQNGAEVIILGCTELPLAITSKHIGSTPIVDPNRVLARKLIEIYAPDKLKA